MRVRTLVAAVAAAAATAVLLPSASHAAYLPPGPPPQVMYRDADGDICVHIDEWRLIWWLLNDEYGGGWNPVDACIPAMT